MAAWSLAADDLKQPKATRTWSFPVGVNALAYTPDGKSMTFVVREKGVDNLWEQPLSGGASFRQLTHFTSERIARFEYSADGTQIAIERAHTESDAVLLRDSGKAK